jgi:hypothetical protein
MNRIALVTFTCSLFACSQDADIGIASQPVSCADVGTADITGRVTDPYTNTVHEFGTVTPRIELVPNSPDFPYTAVLEDGRINLLLGFHCGAAELESYRVEGNREQFDCPLEVTGSVGGQVEYLPAETGTLVVDENSNCLAGRFTIDFGEYGELGGWFSAPWQ